MMQNSGSKQNFVISNEIKRNWQKPQLLEMDYSVTKAGDDAGGFDALIDYDENIS